MCSCMCVLLQLAGHSQPSEFLNPPYLNCTLQRALSLSVHSNDACAQNVGFVLRQMPKMLAKNGKHTEYSCIKFFPGV